MKLYICHKDKQLNKTESCTKCNSKLFAFIANSNEEIFDLENTKDINAVKKAYKQKMSELNEYINRAEPHELCKDIDFQQIAAIYTNTHSLFRNSKDGPSLEYELKKAEVDNLFEKDGGIEKHITTIIGKAFKEPTRIIQSIGGGSIKEKISMIILLVVFGAILYAIPVGGFAVLGLSIIAPTSFLLGPIGIAVFATVSPILALILVKIYRIMDNVLKDIREEVFEIFKTFLMAAYVQRLNESYKGDPEMTYIAIKNFQEIILSQLQRHLVHSLNKSVNFNKMIWEKNKEGKFEEKKIHELFLKNFWNFSSTVKKHTELKELFNLK